MRLVKKVLCVDDNIDSCEVIKLTLEIADEAIYDVTVARTLTEADQFIQQQQFDAILLDQHLPDGTGVDFCLRIRALGIKTPIIFFSADASNATRKAAIAAGAQLYLTKPGDIEHLTETLQGQILLQACRASIILDAASHY